MSTKKNTRTSRQEFLAQNRKFLDDRLKKGQKTLISYVRDEWGQKKGVVVALSPTQIGWSLVHQDQDSFYHRVKPQALPVIQGLQREIARVGLEGSEATDSTVQNIALTRLAELQAQLVDLLIKFSTATGDYRPGVIKSYEWDREKGLHDAFKRALGGKNGDYTKTLANGIQVPDVSVDADVIATVARVNLRTEKFFATPVKPKAQISA